MRTMYVQIVKTVARDSVYKNINYGILDTADEFYTMGGTNAATANLGWRK